LGRGCKLVDRKMRSFVAQRHARALRKQPTDVERRLWHYLRRRQLSGHRFRRQVPIGAYVADFACLEAKLIIEVDGGQHLEQGDYDRRRDREIESRGFRILRFWDNQVLQETQAVIAAIVRALDEQCPHPNLRLRTAEQCLPAKPVGATRERAPAPGKNRRLHTRLRRRIPAARGSLLQAPARPPQAGEGVEVQQ
jgi:very-short-patch-repair endonuclease